MELLFLVFQFWIAVDVCLSRGSYLLLAPKELKLGTDHDVIITASGLPLSQTRFRLYLFPVNNSQSRFSEIRFQLANGRAKDVTVRVNSENVPSPNDNQVVLTLESEDGAIRNHTVLNIKRDPGYIFIQIDKPIYTPRQTVKYRVIALDESQHWAPWRVQIDVINPRGTLVDRIIKTPEEAFNAASFLLSSDPVRGTWKISASFYDQVLTKTAITFDVLEYVLPRFGLKLHSSPDTMCQEEISSLHLTVEARYVYNKPVNGSVALTLLAVGDYGTMYLMEEVGQLDLAGRLQIEVDSSTLYSLLDENDLLDGPSFQLEVHVTVTNRDTDVNETKTFTSTVIKEEPFSVERINYQPLYKLDAEYVYTVKVSSHSGDPMVGQEVECTVTNGSSWFRLRQTTDSSGIAKFVFNPQDTDSFSIKAEVDSVSSDISYPRQKKTGLNQFISISLRNTPKVGRDIRVKIKFSQPPERYCFLVITRGEIVYLRNYRSSPGGEDTRIIPKFKTRKMTPVSRIIVFYIARNGSATEVVTASVVVEIDNKCREEIKLRLRDRQTDRKPKDRDRLEIVGGRGMRVGLLAVDKAVYLKEYKKSLTRKLVFEELERHDLGREREGSGVDALHTFLNAGFSVMTNADVTFPETQSNSQLHSGSYDGSDDEMDSMPHGWDSSGLRSYFPESWLFQETTLNGHGKGFVEITYPDSITTWVIQAVGVSARHGVCMSPSQKVTVSKDFFVDLYLPYKATRLEEIIPKITIANYKHFQLQVSINITGDQGLCFSFHDGFQNVIVPANDIVPIEFSIIPVMAGELAIQVHVEDVYAEDNYDSIRKVLYVVTEGEEMEKTITFNLDPQGMAGRALPVRMRNTVNRTVQDATIKHTLNTVLGEQYTDIDMSLPVETIPGSEKLQIIASGDLLGDVINNILVGDSNDDDDDVTSGEAVMLSLSPVVYSLKYLVQSDDLDQMTLQRGRIHIKNGITNILKFKDESGGFLDKNSQPATWFTAFVLQTLCTAKTLTYVDEDVIKDGLSWLLAQVNSSSSISIQERDGRFYSMTSRDQNAMLAAEILIATKECSFVTLGTIQSRADSLRLSLLTTHSQIENTLTLAKVAYALLLSASNQWRTAAQRLFSNTKRKTTSDGLVYWADVVEDDTSQTPLFYCDGPAADSIESTSYALMMALEYKVWRLPDRIAEWLIKWRNANGVFVGTVDTAIASLALAKYREYKNIQHTSLHLDISNSENFVETLHFNNDTAHFIKSLPEVPHGSDLHVVTRGVGLGQMHVDTKYNIIVDEQALCQFDVTVERYTANLRTLSSTSGFDLCSACNMGCGRPDITCQVDDSRRQHTTYSRIQHCLKICIRYLGFTTHGSTVININMLTGYEPITCDLQKMKGGQITSAIFNRKKAMVMVTLKEVSHTDRLCFGFRIKKEYEVRRLHPALITIKNPSRRASHCTRQYHSGEDTISISTLCYNSRHGEYSGVCHCITSTCAACVPRITLPNIKKDVKKAKYVFKLEAQHVLEQDMMKLMTFRAIEVKKRCLDEYVHTGSTVELLTMNTCDCPVFRPGDQYLAIGEQVYRRKGRDGSDKFHYWIDNYSFVLGDSQTYFTRAENRINRYVRQSRCPVH